MGKTTSPRIKSASLTHQKRISSVDVDDGFQASRSTSIRHTHHLDHQRLRVTHVQIRPLTQRQPADGLRLGQETVVCPLLLSKVRPVQRGEVAQVLLGGEG